MNTDEELLRIKKEFYRLISERFSQNISRLESEIRELQQSANEETKSSAGDKYETGRAMMQIEIDKLGQQLQENIRSSNLLQSFRVGVVYSRLQAGAIGETSSGNFFLLVNGGEFIVDKIKVTAISLQSPLGKILLGRKAGDDVALNGRRISISNVY